MYMTNIHIPANRLSALGFVYAGLSLVLLVLVQARSMEEAQRLNAETTYGSAPQHSLESIRRAAIRDGKAHRATSTAVTNQQHTRKARDPKAEARRALRQRRLR
jgi:hypothetical protein